LLAGQVRAVEIRCPWGRLMHFVLPISTLLAAFWLALLEDHILPTPSCPAEQHAWSSHGLPAISPKNPVGSEHLRWLRRHHPADAFCALLGVLHRCCLRFTLQSGGRLPACFCNRHQLAGRREEGGDVKRHTSNFGPHLASACRQHVNDPRQCHRHHTRRPPTATSDFLPDVHEG